jgi:transposase-like protein
MECPKCKSNKNIKDGIVKQKQRYKCKECNFRYTVASGSGAKPLYLRKMALQLYLEGLGFRSIGRVLNVSNVTVLNWIRSFGEQVAELKSPEQVIYAEMDEMHTYVGQKKAINGYGLLLIDMGKNSSISLLATEVYRQDKNSGKELKIN